MHMYIYIYIRAHVHAPSVHRLMTHYAVTLLLFYKCVEVQLTFLILSVFDICGSCCGVEKIMQYCRTSALFVPRPKKLRVPQHHRHDMHVIDRAAEIRWANGNGTFVVPNMTVTATAATVAAGGNQKKRSHSRSRQKANKKTMRRKSG